MIPTVESVKVPIESCHFDRVSELSKTVSASRLNLWLQCRLKFFFRYILQLPKPPTPSMHAGSIVHAVLQEWNMVRWRREPFSIMKLRTLFGAQWISLQQDMQIDWEGNEESDRNSAWRALQLYFARTPIKNNERPQAVEVRVEADLARHGLPRLIGMLDLVRAGGRIVDFKLVARTPDPEQLFHMNEAQLTCYSVLYRDATGKNESGLELHHLVRTKLPKLIVTTLPPSTELQKTRLLKQIESFQAGLARQDFVPSPGIHCAFCEFFRECRAWNGQKQDPWTRVGTIS